MRETTMRARSPAHKEVSAPARALFAAKALSAATESVAPPPVRGPASEERLRVLHVGCGVTSPDRLHAVFQKPQWEEIRLDIDQKTKPDISGSIIDMQAFAEAGSVDAIWASHVLEHLALHDVSKALLEFRRVLIPSGFALIRSPDIESVAQLIVDGRIRDVIYTSPAGPITPLDMLFGHGDSIKRGADAMRHGTAFTLDSLAHDLLQAGFSELRMLRTKSYEIWALALMPEASIDAILDDLAAAGIVLRDAAKSRPA